MRKCSLSTVILKGGGLAWLALALQNPALADPAAPAPDQPARPIVSEMRIDQFDAIVSKPLFNADRRPQAPAVATPRKTPARKTRPPDNALDGMRVTAIFSGTGTNMAIAALANGEQRLIRAGEMLGEWKVVEIEEGKVTFGKGTQRKVFYLPDFSAALPPPRPPRTRAPQEPQATDPRIPPASKVPR